MATFFRKGEKIWKSISKGCIAFDYYIPMDFVKIIFFRRGCDSHDHILQSRDGPTNLQSHSPAWAACLCLALIKNDLSAAFNRFLQMQLISFLHRPPKTCKVDRISARPDDCHWHWAERRNVSLLEIFLQISSLTCARLRQLNLSIKR